MSGLGACTIVGLLGDGTPVMERAGRRTPQPLAGIEVPQPPSEEYVRFFRERLPRARELRCDETPHGLRVEYLAWIDKSGPVWRDIALALLREGLVRAVPGPSRAQEKYVEEERQARRRRAGIWAGEEPTGASPSDVPSS
jgi:hypothetical protein